MKNSELLDLQTNAGTQDNEQSSSKNNTLWWNVEETPFVVIKKQNQYSIGMLGELVTTKTFASILDAEKYIREKPWELITVTCAILTHYYINKKNEEK